LWKTYGGEELGGGLPLVMNMTNDSEVVAVTVVLGWSGDFKF
jgi:hypothetical protein